MRHNLKLDAKWFDAVRSGRKKAEIRRADRAFRVGDELLLYSHDQSRALLVLVSDILALDEVPGCGCRDFVSLSVEYQREFVSTESVRAELELGSFS